MTRPPESISLTAPRMVALFLFLLPFHLSADLTSVGASWIDQDHLSVAGSPAEESRFGQRVAVGDFDGDGNPDLAIASPFEDGSVKSSGVVHVLLRGPGGGILLDDALELGVSLPGSQETDDRFGQGTLAVADFDGDGYDDLVIGSYTDDVGGLTNSGSILVVPGGPFGMDRARALLIADQPALLQAPEGNDGLGAGMAVGDFDGDGFSDLAFGLTTEVDGTLLAGLVQVLYGSAIGLDFDRIQGWHQGMLALPGDLEFNARFGSALAAGDFDDDGYDELAIGAPRDDIGGIDAGSVTVLRGSSTGLTGDGAKLFSKGHAGLVGTPQSSDLFGGVLLTGDVQGDGFRDLAIADIHHDAGGLDDVGAVWILAGGPDGLSAWQHLVPGSQPVGGALVGSAVFGRRMAFGDFNGDGRDDLAINSEDGIAGQVTVLYGAPGGFAGERTQHWTPASAGLPAPANDNGFGRSLAAGPTGSGVGEELIVGYETATVDGLDYAGAVVVLPSAAATSCGVSPNAHCLQNGRFRAEVRARVEGGPWEDARVVAAVADDSGLFWFFNPRNWEMMLKVLDGCAVNGHFWSYLAATTDVEYEVLLTDSWTGASRLYTNPGGPAQARADVESMAGCGAAPPAGSAPAVPKATELGVTGLGCGLGDEMCLHGGRFRLSVEWETAAGALGDAEVVPLGTELSGLFWFFQEDNWEMMVKVLDGCPVNGHYWVFAAAATNVGYRLHVVDTTTGEEVVHENPVGRLAPAITDVEAFATCP